MNHKTVIIKDGIEDMILTFQVGNSSVERIVKIIKENRKEIERLKNQSNNYAKRIIKAIEYIEKHNYPQLDEMDYYSTSDLLDILKGDVKE